MNMNDFAVRLSMFINDNTTLATFKTNLTNSQFVIGPKTNATRVILVQAL